MNKKLLLIPIVTLILFSLIGIVSAANWDNSINYENNDMTVVIKNFLGLGRELGRVTLTSHTTPTEVRNVFAGKDRVVMYYNFEGWELNEDGLGEIEFIDIRTGKNVDKDYYFAKAIYEDVLVNDYVEVCEIESVNSTSENVCNEMISGTHTESRLKEWERLEDNNIPTGDTTIGLITDVKHNDYIDGVWTIAGKKIRKHAVWTESLNVGLVAYYNFDTDGTDVTGNSHNCDQFKETPVHYDTGGILGGYYNFTGTQSMNCSYLGDSISKNVTMSVWAKVDSGIGAGGMIEHAKTEAYSGNNVVYTIRPTGTDFRWHMDTSVTAIATDAGQNNNAGVWQHFVLVYNGATMKGYINGTEVLSTGLTGFLDQEFTGTPPVMVGQWGEGDGGYFKGGIDEIGIWNRTLSPAEVTQLYNDKVGITYSTPPGVSELTVSLNSPANDSYNSSSTISFNASYTYAVLNTTNATYHIYNSTGTFNKTTIVLTAAANSTILNVSGFIMGDYEWNVYACGENGTATMCAWNTHGNYTFEWRPFSIDSQTYNKTVYETSRQKFELNITTIPSVLSTSAKFIYNGTSYSATTSCVAGVCNIKKSIDIPIIPDSNRYSSNKTFYFNLTLYDGTSSYNFDTVSNLGSQNVSRIRFELCNTTYNALSLNFTTYDEQNLTSVKNFKIGATFDSWLGQGTTKRNESFEKYPVNSTAFCIYPNITHYVDSIIEYDSYQINSTTYVKRNYYLQNESITNNSRDISLYLLSAVDSTSFIQVAQDQKLSAVVGALILTRRYYPADGLYRTVQISKTDDNGESIGFYEAETVDYKHLITLRGLTLLETVAQKVVGKDVPYTLTFTVGDALTIPWEPWEDDPNIVTSLTYNDTSKLVTFSYIDSTDATEFADLLVIQEFSNNNTIVIICNTSSIMPSATLTCDMTGYEGTFLAEGGIGRTNNIVKILTFAISTIKEVLGNLGLLLGFFIVLVAGMAFIWNPVAGVVGINTALWFVSIIGLVSLPFIFLFSILGVSILAIILLKT